MRLVWLVAISCALGCGAKTAAPTGPDPRAAAIAAAASSWLGRSPAPGVQVAVIDDGKVVVEQGFGLADREAPRQVSAGTRFRLGPITEAFTAAAIFRLVDAGKVRLDDPITKYLTDYPNGRVTVRHLLAHQSGIADYAALPEVRERAAEAIPSRDLIALFANAPLAFEPGARVAASASDYYLLGVVVELVTGKPYSEAVHDLVAAPESLVASYCPDAPADEDAQPYTFRDAVVRAEPIAMANPYASGAMCGTAGDVGRFLRALARGLIAGRTFDQMIAAPGLGVELDLFGEHRRIGQGGAIAGAASRAWYFPDDDLAVVVIANSDTAPVDALADTVARIALELPPVAAIESQPLPPDAEGLAGLYQFEHFARRLAVDDGTLTIAEVHDDGTSGWPLRLAHTGNGRFVDAGGGATQVELTDAGIVIVRGNQRFPGAKIQATRVEPPPSTPLQDAGPTDATP
jgi:CubicO group peptidase (beta-lactamase class C family)